MKSLTPVLMLVGMAAQPLAALADPSATSATAIEWNRIALDTIARSKPNQLQVVRLMANLSMAQHAAAADSADALATASMRVIGAMLPEQADYVRGRHAGQEHPKGARVAERVLADAGRDGFLQPWTGRVPQADGAWRSLAQPAAAPAYPLLGTMRTFFIDNGSVLRPAAPPARDSARFNADLAEVRSLTEKPTPESTRLAKFFDMTTGTQAGGFWNEQALELLRTQPGAPRATVVLPTLNGAMMDAFVACHDAKYTYWVPRPSQADASIKPLIGVPNHPSYPSNHSCVSMSAAHVLAHFFPGEAERIKAIAVEAGVSRIHAGLHYRFDVEAGEPIGRGVAQTALSRSADILARRSTTVLGRL